MASPVHSQATPEWVAPAGPAERKNPILTGADSIGRGHVLFSNCVICHGPSGHGDGMAAVALNPKPKDLTAGPPRAKATAACSGKSARAVRRCPRGSKH